MNHLMSSPTFDIVLLTQKEYVNPSLITPYIQNVLLEDQLVTKALESKGLKVTRTFWDNKDFDWSNTRFALFRAVWDYFHRFSEFQAWLKGQVQHTQFINPYSIIEWNMDKHYLDSLQQKKINIPPTLFLERGELRSLASLLKETGWNKMILKPAIAGGARHTYLIDENDVDIHQDVYQELIASESMLVQEFQESILNKGEVSLMVFGGQYSHAVLKNAKEGDFRVQDDFGGTVSPYLATEKEIEFAEFVIAQCDELPVYARVDVMWNNENEPCVSELELVEPELWFRTNQDGALAMANAVYDFIN